MSDNNDEDDSLVESPINPPICPPTYNAELGDETPARTTEPPTYQLTGVERTIPAGSSAEFTNLLIQCVGIEERYRRLLANLTQVHTAILDLSDERVIIYRAMQRRNYVDVNNRLETLDDSIHALRTTHEQVRAEAVEIDTLLTAIIDCLIGLSQMLFQ
ncbi:unnamed protein product [Penicillium glandicola]